MEKIKVVQLNSCWIGDGYELMEYTIVDDKGRIWSKDSRQTEWKQIELPDEPNRPGA